ncbi:K(+)/H(+) antiporter NhaP2 [Tepidimonas sediminis]|uniref:K(+)/H(+) antiporter NhaP2 n=1 Tax=Tepidimonas sediminis TaxID=2588941 RepID=A0A554WP04_9BURK|nr:potassium/proton antiporter [Tepidimonas sediminis]TSE25304.1 K(+)/H(+) antiporter NhaP2 [Tepidimonas sediminis]
MTMSLDFLAVPLLTAASLLLAALVAGLFSARLGFSFLLVFLVAGMLLGEDGPGGVPFEDHRLAFWVGNVALAVILLDGGLRTRLATFRTGLAPAVGLATLGVAVSAAVTGVAARWLLDLDWPRALLLGAIVGSTDAAAVFALLQTSGVRLNERVASTLEIESGLNDPMAVFLTLALIGVATASAAPSWSLLGQGAWALAQQFGVGLVLGVGLGWALAAGLRLLAGLTRPGAGVRALLLLSAGLTVFALTTWLGGSGFLAVYVAGLVIGHRARGGVAPALQAMDGYAWMAQAGMFLLLGLLVTPSALLDTLAPALGVAAALMLVARPLAVALCLAPFRFPPREVAFIAWVGLRGAVPIVLAVFPMMAGVEGARVFFNVAFVVVLASLLLQGASLPWAARRAGVALPDRDDAAAARRVYGDFEVPGETPMAALCAFYGWPPVDDERLSVAQWFARHCPQRPVEGDQLRWGPAELSVRRLRDGVIERVGIRIDDLAPPETPGG